MAIGFQLDIAATTPGFGVQPFGTSAFGGGGQAVLTMPEVLAGSDDPDQTYRRVIGESEHERDGVIIGARKWAERKIWHFIFGRQPGSVIASLLPYYSARKFRFLPDSTQTGTYFLVKWLERDWPGPVLRGGKYDLSITLQEVT